MLLELKSSHSSSSASITSNSIRNCSSPTSSTSSRKIRFIRFSRWSTARCAVRTPQTPRPCQFIEFEETTAEIGHDGADFPTTTKVRSHQALLLGFPLASRPGHQRRILAVHRGRWLRPQPEFWLSLGWTTVNEQRWNAPLYWIKRDGAWWNFTLSGLRPVDRSEPVTHVSYFEADAYANWAGRVCRPSSNGNAPRGRPIEGNFVETERFPSRCRHARCDSGQRRETVFFSKCSATFGNGRAAPTRPTPATEPRLARSANTTASSCAINMSFAADPARRRALTSAGPIAISFSRKNAGSSPGSGSHAIPHELSRRQARRFFSNLTMTGDSITLRRIAPAESADFLGRMLCAACPNRRERLSCKFFYDEGRGLFQKICELPEYYITRTELQILRIQARTSRASSAAALN